MGPGSYGRQASKEDLKAFDEFAAYSRVDPRAKAELLGSCVRLPLEVIALNYGSSLLKGLR